MIVITEGFHPPWVEGSRNVLLGWLASASLYKPIRAIVVTTLDPKYPEPSEGSIKLKLKNAGIIYIKLIKSFHSLRSSLYRTRPPLQLNAWRLLVEYYTHLTSIGPTLSLVRAVKHLLTKITSLYSDVLLLFHNPGPYCLKLCLSSIDSEKLSKVIITLTFSEVNYKILRIIVELAHKSNAKLKIIVSSPYTEWLLRSHLRTLSTRPLNNVEIKTVLPIPLLGSTLRVLGLGTLTLTEREQSENILGKLKDLTQRYAHVILYIGQLNEVRFPSALLFNLSRALGKVNGVIVIISSPSYQSYTYLARIRQVYGDLPNVYIVLCSIDPDTKEKLLELADLAIFPHTASTGGVVDPPLFLIEALFKGKRIVAFSNVSTRTLSRLTQCVRTVPTGKHDEFVNAVLLELKRQDRGECSDIKTLLDPQYVGKILTETLYE